MNNNIIINPLTRISGFLQIEVKVEQNKIIDAKCSGMLFRGFEKMLRGRAPVDAIYFTERICGICSTAHSYASALALEDILQITPDENDKMIRDYIHGCEILQNHIRQFYQYTFPDFVKGPDIEPLYTKEPREYKLPKELNKLLSDHYLESFKYSRSAHEMLAVLGGKAPHNHGIFIGGITVNLDAAKFIKIKSILNSIKNFLDNIMIPDVYILADYYAEYFENGRGYGNLLTYGIFDTYKEKSLFYVSPKVFIDGQFMEFNSDEITENIHNAWYTANKEVQKPTEMTVEDNRNKQNAYSFIKAPRYDGFPMEVGPLARMWCSREYTRGISTMDRIIARVLETRKIAGIMEGLLERIVIKKTNQGVYEFPSEASGKALTDTCRGALGHWVSILNKEINNYEIITPSTWNLSPEDSDSVIGVIEKSLIGAEIKDLSNPVEIGIIVRSFDSCVSCATHVISDKYSPLHFRIL